MGQEDRQGAIRSWRKLECFSGGGWGGGGVGFQALVRESLTGS